MTGNNMTSRQIIGLLGAKGSGKDTAAKFLIELRNFKRVSFAERLYEEVASCFGVTTDFLGDRSLVETPNGLVERKEHPAPELALRNCKEAGFVRCVLEERALEGVTLDTPLSPRVVMQLWGTEFRRKRGDDNYWLNIVEQVLNANPQTSYVITDVRFPNEHAFVHRFGGECMRIRNVQVEAREEANRALSGTAAHPSETAAMRLPVYAELHNVMGDLNALKSAVLAAVDSINEKEPA